MNIKEKFLTNKQKIAQWMALGKGIDNIKHTQMEILELKNTITK
jgi:hypothetical protein